MNRSSRLLLTAAGAFLGFAAGAAISLRGRRQEDQAPLTRLNREYKALCLQYEGEDR